MTQDPITPLDRDSLRATLQRWGRRYTPQRHAVYRTLARSGDHPTAEDVYQGVKAEVPNISLATVYKALETLVATGLATRLTAGEGAGSNSARYDARGEHHYHLRCLRSGTVRDLPTSYDPNLIAKLDPALGQRLFEQGFTVTGYRLELVGYFGPGDGS